LEIVYEDQALLVVDKPAGMVVHPAPGHPGGTLVNALLAHCPELSTSGDERPGIVHRLDRDTSGLILVAKSNKARRALQRQFKERQVSKAYLALLDGHLQPAWGRIEAPVGRHPQHRQRMTVLAGGREAITEYHVLEQFAHQVGPAAGDYTLVEAQPLTGRTHQIRVHFASIHHPVVGDEVYGRRRQRLPLSRQFLHARRLGFRHPLTGERLSLEAPLPAELSAVLALLHEA
jgi:23S rRNA pseudouridine1911/1915/1917 synthase